MNVHLEMPENKLFARRRIFFVDLYTLYSFVVNLDADVYAYASSSAGVTFASIAAMIASIGSWS